MKNIFWRHKTNVTGVLNLILRFFQGAQKLLSFPGNPFRLCRIFGHTFKSNPYLWFPLPFRGNCQMEHCLCYQIIGLRSWIVWKICMAILSKVYIGCRLCTLFTLLFLAAVPKLRLCRIYRVIEFLWAGGWKKMHPYMWYYKETSKQHKMLVSAESSGMGAIFVSLH